MPLLIVIVRPIIIPVGKPLLLSYFNEEEVGAAVQKTRSS